MDPTLESILAEIGRRLAEEEAAAGVYTVEYPGRELNPEVYCGPAEPVPPGCVRIGYAGRVGMRYRVLPVDDLEAYMDAHPGTYIILGAGGYTDAV